jgi:hypothetical protein
VPRCGGASLEAITWTFKSSDIGAIKTKLIGRIMSADFFEKPILNLPYDYPSLHWELDDDGQPATQILNSRRQFTQTLGALAWLLG